MSKIVIDLRPNQLKAVESLILTGDIDQAANAANVNRRTVYRWLNEEPFRAALSEAETEMVRTAARLSATAASEAIMALLDILRDEDSTPGQRISAARTILGTVGNIRLLGSIEEKLAQIERMNNED